MQTRLVSKYHLKDLHEEISLFDRKIAHCQNIQRFDCDEERSRELERLGKKRDLLVKSATQMAAMGIEYDPDRLPPSMKQAKDEAIGSNTQNLSEGFAG